METHKKKHYGRCRLCMRTGRFTKEHVPPRKAFNSGTFLISSTDSEPNTQRVIRKTEEEQPGGIALFTLCDSCNSKTGRQYGGDYVKFVEIVKPNANPSNVNQDIEINFAGLHPLRVVKQVTSMLLSTSNPTDFRDHEYVGRPGRSKKDLEGIKVTFPTKEHQREVYEELRLFVKQRDRTQLPAGVSLQVFASVGRRLGFRTGIFTRIDLSLKNAIFCAVTGLYPVHWVFSFAGDGEKGLLNVTKWANYGYKDRFETPVSLPMRWLEGHYPLDFRSPQDLYAGNFVNSMRFEGLVTSENISKDDLLSEALFFARTLGKLTKEGYLVSSFTSGTFYEFEDLNGWLEGADPNEARRLLEFRLSNRL